MLFSFSHIELGVVVDFSILSSVDLSSTKISLSFTIKVTINNIWLHFLKMVIRLGKRKQNKYMEQFQQVPIFANMCNQKHL
jgi:hypothetical protein